MYGIEKGVLGDFGIGSLMGFIMIFFSRIFPAFTLAVPYIVGLSITGQWIVVIFIAPIIEEVFFRGALLGFLGKKEPDPAKIDGFKRAIMIIVISFFMIGWIVSNLMFQAGMVYAILAMMSLVIYALWDKIPTLNINFHLANLITGIAFGVYHINAYAKEITASAIMSVSATFMSKS